jgi:hypothetical protein
MADYFICPVCGTEVDVDAVVCPECGSDDETGWSTESAFDGLYLYEDDEDNLAPQRNAKSRPWLKYVIPSIILITLSARNPIGCRACLLLHGNRPEYAG